VGPKSARGNGRGRVVRARAVSRQARDDPKDKTIGEQKLFYPLTRALMGDPFTKLCQSAS
jgi:hypothetical protein